MIGVLDWGIGGMFAALRLIAREPTLDLLYLSDTGSVPYGLLPRRDLLRRVQGQVRFLQDRGATQILLGCHSASTTLSALRAEVPIFGVIDPAPVPRDVTSILFLGGRRTIRSGLWHRALSAHSPGARVRGRIAQPLSAWIEAGKAQDPGCLADVDRILAGPPPAVLVLACTHYAALRSAIQSRHPGSHIVDPALFAADRLAVPAGAGRVSWRTTGDPSAMAGAASVVFGVRIEAEPQEA